MQHMRGTVKWFNIEKGYGFITAQDGQDVFVHYSEILMGGFKALQEGDLVELEVVPGVWGPMAARVVKPSQRPTNGRMQEPVRGRVKWFKAKKGYGFITTQDGQDVFVHYSEILMDGFKALLEGDLVELEIVSGARGPMAARVIKLGEIPKGPRPQATENHALHDQQKPGSAWDVLGVKEGATPEEISTAYHRAASMYHPDKVNGLGPEFRELAERCMKEINAAHEELKRQPRH